MMSRRLPGLLWFLLVVSRPLLASACLPGESAVRVNLRGHVLWLCEGGKVRQAYPISIGWAGVGKRHQGDHKTPLGTYSLGKPRHSESYGVFIPIGYPTLIQRVLGFTGSAVGLHGPPRLGTSYDPSAARDDWTEGCIAFATDRAASEVAAWLERTNVTLIHIFS